MTDEQFEDIKQLITTSASQTEQFLGDQINDLGERVGSLDERVGNLDERVASLDERVGNLNQRVASLDTKLELVRQELHEGFASIADAITPLNDTVDDHEERLTKLESQKA